MSSDDDDRLGLLPDPELGTITVQINRFERMRPSEEEIDWPSPVNILQDKHKLHEKEKKLGGHCVS